MQSRSYMYVSAVLNQEIIVIFFKQVHAYLIKFFHHWAS